MLCWIASGEMRKQNDWLQEEDESRNKKEI